MFTKTHKVLFFRILLILLLKTLVLNADASLYRFYQPSHGLGGTFFENFYNDSHGYIWLATNTGLSRFDGYDFYVYVNESDDTTSINSSHIYSFLEDSKGNFWIGTHLGLNRYDRSNDKFDRIKLIYNHFDISTAIFQILEDDNGLLWLITSNGLFKYDSVKQQFICFNTKFEENGFPSYTQFMQGVVDGNGNLIITSNSQGLIVFNFKSEQFHSFSEFCSQNRGGLSQSFNVIQKIDNQNVVIGSQRGELLIYNLNTKRLEYIPFINSSGERLQGGITSIVVDKFNKIWVGTDYNGVLNLDLKTKVLTSANSEIEVENADKSRILCFKDRREDLWFGIHYQGLYHQIAGEQSFKSISPSADGLNHQLVKSILLDRHGNLWVGTDGGSLNVRLKGASKFNPVEDMLAGGEALKNQVVMCLKEDKAGRIWIGTYLSGIYVYDPQRRVIQSVENKTLDKVSMPSVFDLEEDGLGNIWAATNGDALWCINPQTLRVDHINQIEAEGKTLTLNRYLNDICIDKDGVFWLASYNGFFCWNLKKHTFRLFRGFFDKANDEPVYAIRQSKDGSLWMATVAGLYKYNPLNDSIVGFSEVDGLSNSNVKALEIDNQGLIWMSTGNGISVYNEATRMFKRYFTYDGLQFNEFLSNASFLDDKGLVYFGGTNGLVYFNPSTITSNNTIPKLVFSNLRILNQEVIKGKLPDGRRVLTHSINETDTLELGFEDKSFSVDFGAIDFVAPEKIKYAVQLKGFDNDWSIRDYRQRTATYTNLNPGTYLFLVKSTNVDGLWLENEKHLIVIIHPPFWLTWWAFIIYTLILGAIVYSIRWVIIFRYQMKSKLQLEHLERQKLESINQAKSQFFTNISHEIRTPLTMLLAPLSQLARITENEKQQKYIGYIERNTNRLQRLINQLLEFQKVEDSQLKLTASKIDVVAFVKEILALFETSAKEKGVDVYFESEVEILETWIDTEKMDKIIFNLISNSLKFTDKGGCISILIKANPKSFQLVVTDTGIGIEPQYQARVFDRFFQVENFTNQGTGIGLHLTKKLVEVHHGNIQVSSTPGKGTCFTIEIPTGDGNYRESEKVHQAIKPLLDSIISFDSPVYETSNEITDLNKPTILCIEDDVEILDYLALDLGDKYNILKASNGNEGWEMVKNHNPELIISDIMMPGMNGIELCHAVKTTLETSHIPLIMLTARTSTEQEIEGLENGADAYIHKPFHPTILKLHVDRIIESRKKLQQQFSETPSFVAKEMTVTSADERFLQQAMDYVKDNMMDTDLSVERMCVDLSISRVQLYRKLKALTNQVPTEFIRIIRLKQAAYLLEMNKLSVSEVAYQVGFNSHQYFTTSFQKYFKVSPTEFLKNKSSKSL